MDEPVQITVRSEGFDALPMDLAAAHAMILEERRARLAADLKVAQAKAEASETVALIEHLKLQILKLRRQIYGVSSERTARLIDQLELELSDLEADATEDELAAEMAARKLASSVSVKPFERKRPGRKPFPDGLPVERRVLEAPKSCPCCGGSRLTKVGEAVTRVLETVPRSWKVIETAREKVSCRDCEKMFEEPAPFYVTPRGFLGPQCLAMIVFEKFGQHQPLNRQSERYAKEGIDLSLSTLADQVGACAAATRPLFKLMEDYTFKAKRLHGDDTTIPIWARGETITGRIWTYVKDDRPFGGKDPPSAIFYASGDRKGEHPRAHLENYSGILQADGYGGYDHLYEARADADALTAGFCWAHARRKFFELCDVTRKKGKSKGNSAISPTALEAVKRMDALFAIERDINGAAADVRLSVRQARSAPIVADLFAWMRERREKLSKHDDVARAMYYLLERTEGFTTFLTDGRICMTNNAAERALRGVALGRRSWMFAGSLRGAERAAMFYSFIQTCRLNDIDAQVYLADVFARIADIPQSRLHELLPWEWAAARAPQRLQAAA